MTESPMVSPAVHTPTVNGYNDNSESGYDYEFEPILDDKYQCPICLLALRDPVQTSCGHRFCHLCILRCIRNKAKCPIDQMPLSNKQLFQDRSANREVQDLKVKCPNKGCIAVLELRNIHSHLESCVYGKVLCRHECGKQLLLKEVKQHEEHECPNRLITCSVCEHKYKASTKKDHEEECKQNEPVECQYCRREVKRYRLNQHISRECPQAPIKCVFEKVGCFQEHSRHYIQEHMQSSTQIHLQYLLSAVSSLQKQNEALQNTLSEAQNKIDKFESAEKVKEPSPVILGPGCSRLNFDYMNTVQSENIYASASIVNNNATNITPNTSEMENEEYDEIALIKAYNKHMEEGGDVPMSSSSSLASSPAVNTTMTADNCLCGSSAGLKILQNKHTDHDEKIVSLDHHVRELMAKTETHVVQMKEIITKISQTELRLDQQELRCCNGLYYWKIKEYARLRKAASMGEMSVLHSPGFYTSSQGYRMCVRANLDGVENAQGTHLSLFVHIMKGEFDDFLAWPFSGTITLTVINQREIASQRSHISETLEARQNLMAFQRPTTERNQKGYGYIDFFPLKMIENEGFIKDNTLVIKAQVKVNEQIIVK